MLRYKAPILASSWLLTMVLAGPAYAVWTAGLNYAVHDPMGDPTRDSRITLSQEYKFNLDLGLRWEKETDPDIRYGIGSTFGAGLEYKLTDKPSFRIGADYQWGRDELRTRLGSSGVPQDSAQRALGYTPYTPDTDLVEWTSLMEKIGHLNRGLQVRADDGRYVTDQSGIGSIPKLDLDRYRIHTTFGGYTWATNRPILEGTNSLMLPQWNFVRGALSGG